MAVSTIKNTVANTKVASSSVTVSGNTINTITLTVNDASFALIKGFGVFSNENIVIMQCLFSAPNTITVRVRNLISSSQTATVQVYYC